MKLLASEQKDILALLDVHNLKDQYLLVKRKGWVHIEIGEVSFSFHRKKSVELIGGKFKDKTQYFIKESKVTLAVDSFAEVKASLAAWLKSR